MAAFQLGYGYRHFEESVKSKARYIHGKTVDHFLDSVLTTSRSRLRKIRTGSIWWRAQLGSDSAREIEGDIHSFEIEEPFSQERMVPAARYAVDGRVNPSGIPCLYLASNAKTAMAEVRPWKGSFVSLARFKVAKDCIIVDCTTDKRTMETMLAEYDNEATADELEKGVWADLAEAFSTPVSPNQTASEYVPTQILAEAFRSHGYGGVVYRSFLGKGRNVALFDIGSAKFVSSTLQKTIDVDYTFESVPCG